MSGHLMEEQKNLVDKLLSSLYLPEELPNTQNIISYLTLLFNNLVRFIGEDFTPLNIMRRPFR